MLLKFLLTVLKVPSSVVLFISSSSRMLYSMCYLSMINLSFFFMRSVYSLSAWSAIWSTFTLTWCFIFSLSSWSLQNLSDCSLMLNLLVSKAYYQWSSLLNKCFSERIHGCSFSCMLSLLEYSLISTLFFWMRWSIFFTSLRLRSLCLSSFAFCSILSLILWVAFIQSCCKSFSLSRLLCFRFCHSSNCNLRSILFDCNFCFSIFSSSICYSDRLRSFSFSSPSNSSLSTSL